MNRTIVAAAVFAVPLSLAACAHSGSAPRWGYAGDHGPERWSSIASDFATCGTGKHQSPIDIVGAKTAELPSLEIQYRPARAVVRNNGHTIQVDLQGAGTITLGEHAYTLKQLRFHLPAEHSLGGERPAMELQLVHADGAGALVVVGVFLRAGAESAALAPIFSGLPKVEGGSRTLTAKVDASALLPVERQQFRYDGSLTTPPCAENVSWTVMKDPVELSEAQIAAFRALFDGNSRPLQPLGDRVITTDATN